MTLTIDRVPRVHNGNEGWNGDRETATTSRHLRFLWALTRPNGRDKTVPTRKSFERTENR